MIMNTLYVDYYIRLQNILFDSALGICSFLSSENVCQIS